MTKAQIAAKVTDVHPKVATAGLAGAVTVVIVWALTAAGLDVPPEVASAFTVIVSVAAGYLKP